MNLLLPGAVAAAYGVLVGGLYLLQDGMIFPRKPALHARYPLPEHSERLKLETPEGQVIQGHLVRASRRSKGLILSFTGNAWNADDNLTFVANRFEDYDVVAFHYRGYAPSEGEPSEAALFADAKLIFDRVTQGLEPDRVYAFGFSIGSGVAAHLAANRDLTGLVLVTPFDSIAAVAAKRYPFVPVNWLIKHSFDSVAHLKDVAVPAAVVIASDDRIVPLAHTERLVDSLVNPVHVETVPNTTHGGIYDHPEIEAVLRRSVDAIDAARLQGQSHGHPPPHRVGRADPDEGAAGTPPADTAGLP